MVTAFRVFTIAAYQYFVLAVVSLILCVVAVDCFLHSLKRPRICDMKFKRPRMRHTIEGLRVKKTAGGFSIGGTKVTLQTEPTTEAEELGVAMLVHEKLSVSKNFEPISAFIGVLTAMTLVAGTRFLWKKVGDNLQAVSWLTYWTGRFRNLFSKGATYDYPDAVSQQVNHLIRKLVHDPRVVVTPAEMNFAMLLFHVLPEFKDASFYVKQRIALLLSSHEFCRKYSITTPALLVLFGASFAFKPTEKEVESQGIIGDAFAKAWFDVFDCKSYVVIREMGIVLGTLFLVSKLTSGIVACCRDVVETTPAVASSRDGKTISQYMDTPDRTYSQDLEFDEFLANCVKRASRDREYGRLMKRSLEVASRYQRARIDSSSKSKINDQPFTVFLYGPTKQGKTTVSSIIGKYCAAEIHRRRTGRTMKESDVSVYAPNTSCDFDDGLKMGTQVAILDDVMTSSQSGYDRLHNMLFQMVNVRGFTSVQADVDNKGLIDYQFSVVMFLYNNPDIPGQGRLDNPQKEALNGRFPRRYRMVLEDGKRTYQKAQLVDGEWQVGGDKYSDLGFLTHLDEEISKYHETSCYAKQLQSEVDEAGGAVRYFTQAQGRLVPTVRVSQDVYDEVPPGGRYVHMRNPNTEVPEGKVAIYVPRLLSACTCPYARDVDELIEARPVGCYCSEMMPEQSENLLTLKKLMGKIIRKVSSTTDYVYGTMRDHKYKLFGTAILSLAIIAVVYMYVTQEREPPVVAQSFEHFAANRKQGKTVKFVTKPIRVQSIPVDKNWDIPQVIKLSKGVFLHHGVPLRLKDGFLEILTTRHGGHSLAGKTSVLLEMGSTKEVVNFENVMKPVGADLSVVRVRVKDVKVQLLPRDSFRMAEKDEPVSLVRFSDVIATKVEDVNSGRVATTALQYEVGGVKTEIYDYFTYKYPGSKGDCGYYLLGSDDRIVGIHIAFHNLWGLSCAHTFTPDVMQALYDGSVDWDSDFKVPSNLGCIEHAIANGSFVSSGTCPSLYGSSPVSRLVRNSCPVFSGVGPQIELVPSVLTTQGDPEKREIYSPVLVNLDKVIAKAAKYDEVKEFDPKSIIALGKFFKTKGCPKYRELSETDVYFGCDTGAGKLTGFDEDAAMGCCSERFGTKKGDLAVGGKLTQSFVDWFSRIKKKVLERGVASLDVPDRAAKVMLKDELLPPEKDTRTIYACSLAAAFFVKKHIGTFIAWVHNNPVDSMLGVGIDPQTHFPQMWAKYNKVLAVDSKQYDKSVTAAKIRAAIDVIGTASEMPKHIRKQLCDFVVDERPLSWEGFLMYLKGLLPSGVIATSVLGGIIMVLIFLNALGEERVFTTQEQWDDAVHELHMAGLVTYGDDVIIGDFPVDVQFLISSAAAKGITLTGPDKTELPSYVPPSEATFVGRYFRDGLCPLRPQTLANLCTYRWKNLSEIDYYKQVAVTFYREGVAAGVGSEAKEYLDGWAHELGIEPLNYAAIGKMRATSCGPMAYMVAPDVLPAPDGQEGVEPQGREDPNQEVMSGKTHPGTEQFVAEARLLGVDVDFVYKASGLPQVVGMLFSGTYPYKNARYIPKVFADVFHNYVSGVLATIQAVSPSRNLRREWRRAVTSHALVSGNPHYDVSYHHVRNPVPKAAWKVPCYIEGDMYPQTKKLFPLLRHPRSPGLGLHHAEDYVDNAALELADWYDQIGGWTVVPQGKDDEASGNTAAVAPSAAEEFRTVFKSLKHLQSRPSTRVCWVTSPIRCDRSLIDATPPTVTGDDSVDQLGAMWSGLVSGSIANKTLPGQLLAQWNAISPGFFTQNNSGWCLWPPSLVAVACGEYYSYQTVDFMVTFFGPARMQGVMRMDFFHPVSDPPTASQDPIKTYLMDLATSRTFTFSVPWMCPDPVKSVTPCQPGSTPTQTMKVHSSSGKMLFYPATTMTLPVSDDSSDFNRRVYFQILVKFSGLRVFNPRRAGEPVAVVQVTPPDVEPQGRDGMCVVAGAMKDTPWFLVRTINWNLGATFYFKFDPDVVNQSSVGLKTLLSTKHNVDWDSYEVEASLSGGSTMAAGITVTTLPLGTTRKVELDYQMHAGTGTIDAFRVGHLVDLWPLSEGGTKVFRVKSYKTPIAAASKMKPKADHSLMFYGNPLLDPMGTNDQVTLTIRVRFLNIEYGHVTPNGIELCKPIETPCTRLPTQDTYNYRDFDHNLVPVVSVGDYLRRGTVFSVLSRGDTNSTDATPYVTPVEGRCLYPGVVERTYFLPPLAWLHCSRIPVSGRQCTHVLAKGDVVRIFDFLRNCFLLHTGSTIYSWVPRQPPSLIDVQSGTYPVATNFRQQQLHFSNTFWGVAREEGPESINSRTTNQFLNVSSGDDDGDFSSLSSFATEMDVVSVALPVGDVTGCAYTTTAVECRSMASQGGTNVLTVEDRYIYQADRVNAAVTSLWTLVSPHIKQFSAKVDEGYVLSFYRCPIGFGAIEDRLYGVSRLYSAKISPP